MSSDVEEAFFTGGSRGSLDDPAAVRALLIAAARDTRILTYSQALNALGSRFSRPKMRLLCRVIGDIDDTARASGEPELAVLVVRASDGMPGDGWWRGQSRTFDHAEPSQKRKALDFVRKRQTAAFKYWRNAKSA